MNPHQITRLFPNASQSTIAANAHDYGAGTPAVLERRSGDGPLGTAQAQASTTGRVHIRFTSIRKRLLDPDNLCEKWLLDCLRYCRVIRGDEPDKITLETTQRKATKGEEEKTMIEIWT